MSHKPASRRLARLTLTVASLLAASAVLIPSAALAARFTAHVWFPRHNPVMNQKWPIKITAKHNGRKVHGSTRYQFYVGSSLVAHRKGISFYGVGHDTLKFPGAAVGHRLKLRVLVATKYGTVGFSRYVTTQK